MVTTGNGTFQQYGTITFEDSRDRLHFSTQGQGRIEDRADGKLASATPRPTAVKTASATQAG